ncbi:BZ3500_MvSof-1268-A1-R1_Chr6-2g08476 [Microbotryum saponariae]|uniref:histidine kinase n=1 Tax=Microbotryum saponariae TaxID=289078 RepID=A0A2X0MLL9_9BASI|nr:BZ3500_MvSof-1268-A1-R1_Chr6-2g08476 [Microbotryum saponariae]SDA07753.1 BZ3501_MvSof-1269-A2-R1_Chr6-1g08190 [Microbotryum saponariae]
MGEKLASKEKSGAAPATPSGRREPRTRSAAAAAAAFPAESNAAKARHRLHCAWSATKQRIGVQDGVLRDEVLTEATDMADDAHSLHCHASIKRARSCAAQRSGTAADTSSAPATNSISGADQPAAQARATAAGAAARGEEVEDVSVDAVVVENEGMFRTWGGTADDEHASATGHGGKGGAPKAASAKAEIAEGTKKDDASIFREVTSNYGGPVIIFCRWTKTRRARKIRISPSTSAFFAPQFESREIEAAYQKDSWTSMKRSVLYGTLFFEINWILSVSMLPKPWSAWNLAASAVLMPLSTIPLVPMALWDWPALHRGARYWIWQSFVFLAVLIASTNSIVDMALCAYFAPDRHCGAKDFLTVFFYAAAPPAVSLFALNQVRVGAFGIFVAWTGLVLGTFLRLKGSFIRSAINLFIFYVFLLMYSHQREINDRRTFTLRLELKRLYRLKQKAEHRERREADASKRFSNFLFHEVRVPLNTSTLAFQNIKESGIVMSDTDCDLSIEFEALESSLAAMAQVLNDVLDHSKLEKGGFSMLSSPFSLHRAMHSIFNQLQLDVDARRLTLETHLDARIDEVCVKSAWPTSEWPTRILEGDGFLLGDEMRLRQILTNLTSNAVKFTSAGGKVAVTTKLLRPSFTPGGYQRPEPSPSDYSDLPTSSEGYSDTEKGLTSATLEVFAVEGSTSSSSNSSSRDPGEVIVVRFEVRDTGVGIRPRDMQGDRSLFSSFVQTEVGMRQGGTGTGLGLSLVRQLVKLSGGRLGVTSKVGYLFKWALLPWSHRSTTLSRRSNLKLDLTRGPSNSLRRRHPARTWSRRRTSTSDGSDAIEMIAPSEKEKVKSGASEVPQLAISPPAVTPIPTPSTATSSSPAFKCLSGTSPPLPTQAAISIPAVVPMPSPLSLLSITRTPATPPLEFQDGPIRVLVVDDDALTRKLMTRMIERGGSLVSTANDGEQALELILARKESDPVGVHVYNYDVIFLDNQMPKQTGLEVVQALRTLGREDLVVGVTANAMQYDQDEYRSRGADEVLTKPVAEASLRNYCAFADVRRKQRREEVAATSSSAASEPLTPPQRPPLTHFLISRDSSRSIPRAP